MTESFETFGKRILIVVAGLGFRSQTIEAMIGKPERQTKWDNLGLLIVLESIQASDVSLSCILNEDWTKRSSRCRSLIPIKPLKAPGAP